MRKVSLLAALVLVVAACSGGASDTQPAVTTTVQESTTTNTAADVTTTSTAAATTTSTVEATTTSTVEASTTSTVEASTTTSTPAEVITTTTDTVEVTTTTTAAVAGGHPLVIASIDFEGDVIVVRNNGDEPYDLTGHFLCNRPNYMAVPAGTLAPGDTMEISATSLFVTATSGELGLYTSNSFGSADAIVRYVQWGSDPHGRTSVAVSAGVWAAGNWVDSGAAGIQSSGDDPISAADWSSS